MRKIPWKNVWCKSGNSGIYMKYVLSETLTMKRFKYRSSYKAESSVASMLVIYQSEGALILCWVSTVARLHLHVHVFFFGTMHGVFPAKYTLDCWFMLQIGNLSKSALQFLYFDTWYLLFRDKLLFSHKHRINFSHCYLIII